MNTKIIVYIYFLISIPLCAFNKPSALIICMAKEFGGAENHVLHLLKNLSTQNYKVTTLLRKKSPLKQELKKYNLPYYACTTLQKSTKRVLEICKKEKINIIHCNTKKEVTFAKKIDQQHPVQLVFTQHTLDSLHKAAYQGLNKIICVSSTIKEELVKKDNTLPIECIPPVYDFKKFENYTTNQTKKEFFKKEFGIDITNAPILCTVANLYKTKNHKLLFYALHDLIHKEKNDVQLILAGTGNLKKKLIWLAKQLQITKHVHFLGFTKKIPDILFHSDIHILPSKKEGLGITLLESSIMKKPNIVSSNTGMSDIIKNNQTGLIFKNNDKKDLIKKINILIENPEKRNELGNNAYTFVKENFSPEAIIKKHCRIYRKLCS